MPEETGESELPTRAYRVFAQREDARLELSMWQQHAEKFFRTRLTLAAPKEYAFGVPTTDTAKVVVTPPEGREATRVVAARPRTDEDLRTAEDTDARAGSTELGLLARRCKMIWLIGTQAEDDRPALLLAAIVASVVLGPILSPDEQQLFGVKTARQKLEGATGPYR
jgi:hypothetical protein